jgi:propionyl-CoA synthetase
MSDVFGVMPGVVYFCARDVWFPSLTILVVGHSYIVYGPLVHRACSVLYEGKPVGTPDAAAYWRLTQEYKINHIFCAPTAIRAIKKMDPEGLGNKRFDTSSLVNIWLAGERCDTDSLSHFKKLLGVPIRDHYWVTETGNSCL